MTTSDLPRAWRTRADELEAYASPAAVAYRRAADELEEAMSAAEDELLPPGPAADVSGLSERTLREHRAKGKLKDYGKPGRPRYRRGDLPRRSGAAAGSWDAEQHVRGIVS